MAKPIQKSKKLQSSKLARQRKEIVFPLDKSNLMIIGFGILLLIIGYILMTENSVNGFLPTVISPILLVLGYCVVIPYGIIKKPSKTPQPTAVTVTTENLSTEPTSQSQSSNIKTG